MGRAHARTNMLEHHALFPHAQLSRGGGIATSVRYPCDIRAHIRATSVRRPCDVRATSVRRPCDVRAHIHRTSSDIRATSERHPNAHPAGLCDIRANPYDTRAISIADK